MWSFLRARPPLVAVRFLNGPPLLIPATAPRPALTLQLLPGAWRNQHVAQYPVSIATLRRLFLVLVLDRCEFGIDNIFVFMLRHRLLSGVQNRLGAVLGRHGFSCAVFDGLVPDLVPLHSRARSAACRKQGQPHPLIMLDNYPAVFSLPLHPGGVTVGTPLVLTPKASRPA